MEDSPEGCFGVLRIQKQMFCLTLEPPDFVNQKWKSCIPVQQYTCTRHKSQMFGDTFAVKGVPNREAIIFHWGNWLEDTRGCILLGNALMHKRNKPWSRGVANSRNTFKRFMNVLADQQELHLTISTGY